MASSASPHAPALVPCCPAGATVRPARAPRFGGAFLHPKVAMGMPRARRVLAGLLLLVAGSALACAEASAPPVPKEPSSAASHQQQAGYPLQPGDHAPGPVPNFA